LNVGVLAGYLSFSPLVDRVGRRRVFALMCVGSLVMLPVTFLTPRTCAQVLLLLPLPGVFQQRHFQRLSDLPAGVVSHADSRDRRGVLFQHGPGAGFHGSVCDRLPGYDVAQCWPRRQRRVHDLSRRIADSAIRAGDARQTTAGIIPR
jgi:hypothetical protein